MNYSNVKTGDTSFQGDLNSNVSGVVRPSQASVFLRELQEDKMTIIRNSIDGKLPTL